MEINRREFLTLAAAGAANLAVNCAVNSRKKPAGSDTGKSPDLENDGSSNYEIRNDSADSPQLPPDDECLGEPVDAVKSTTNTKLQEIYAQAGNILDGALNILENASEHGEYIQRGGGGPIFAEKTVQATAFDDETVQIISNDRDFGVYMTYGSLDDPEFNPVSDKIQLSLHREPIGADGSDEQFFYIDMPPGIYFPSRKITHECLPDQPTMLQEILTNDIGQRSVQEPEEIPSAEYFRLVIHIRDRVKAIMDEYGIDTIHQTP